MPTIADYLKYANVQMAAEALFGFDANVNPNQVPRGIYSGPILASDLTTGTLNGGEGDDTLAGGSGDDTLEGGAGVDTYIVGQGADSIIDADGNMLLSGAACCGGAKRLSLRDRKSRRWRDGEPVRPAANEKIREATA